MKEQVNLFLESSQQLLNEIATTIPQILGAVLILLIGWLIARVVKKLFIKLLLLVRFNFLTEKSGIEKFLKEGGVKLNASEILGALIYWIIMLIVIMATLNSLNLASASLLFNEILLYIPNIIVAIVILIIGIYLARMVSQILLTSLKNMKDKTATFISQLAFYAIIVLTVFVTISQLNIAQNIINSAFQLLFGGLCLALGLAFGLGGKDKAAEIINDMFKKRE
ncbi:MAG: hypothetical protein ISS17_06100 [Bacteroidales bacterium]|nr:hypothetical protein [Bacteroidales bacterium]